MGNQELIRQVPLFASLPSEEIHQLDGALRWVEVPPHVILFHEGDHGARFSIILKGEVEIVKARGTPEERVLSVLEAGDYFGEMSLLENDGVRTAGARTRTAAQFLEMTQADFVALLARQPRLGLEILRRVSLRLRVFENATIRDLREKNRQLAQAYEELKAAQALLIEKEKLDHELAMARRIQQSNLPKQLPELPGWAVDAHWQPARVVSGDLYDFISFPDGKMAAVVADVTGKGIPAALVMATTRSILRATAQQLVTPARVLAWVNDLLVPDIPEGMSVTCLYALIDPATGHVRFANAGHNLACLCSRQGPRELYATGMPLGWLPDRTYDEAEAVVECGETLLLYSDGLTEAHSPHGEMYGFPRLQEHLAARLPDGQTLIESLLRTLIDFTGSGSEQEDDVTLVTLRRL